MRRRVAPTADDLLLLDPDGEFLQRLEVDRLTIARLLDAGDETAIRPVVHRLAGAAGTFGFPEISDIAIELDDAAVAGDPLAPGGVRQLLAALTRATEKSA